MELNVLASIHLYPPFHNCGSEWFLHHINKFLISKGHHVRVILHQDKMHNIATPYIYEGVEVFGHTGRVDSYMWGNVILTHLDFTQYTLVMAASIKRPVIHFVHNDIPYSSIQGAFRGTNVVYNSKWISDRLAYQWPSMVMPPPCDAKYYDVGDDRGDAITLISLNKNKGARMFYEIAKLMPHRNFIGVVGSYDEQLLNAPPNVTIIENSPDILRVYKMTRILLMPSAYESWGRTATEAMCSGIPVICTPTPGLKENCGDAAIYIGTPIPISEPGEPQADRGRPEDWVKAINKVESDYSKYSLLCRQRAAQLDPNADLERLHDFIMGAAERGY